jgi:hypothetical protein
MPPVRIFAYPVTTVGQRRTLCHRGTTLVNRIFLLRTTADPRIRLRKLLEATP